MTHNASINENQSAIDIQRIWRAFASRARNTKPHMSRLSNYQAFLISNEPMVGVEEKHKPVDSKFVFLGTSLLRTLEILLDLSSKFFSDCRVDFNYYNTPKMFILDYSNNVFDMWKLLKSCFYASTYDEFIEICSSDKVKSKVIGIGARGGSYFTYSILSVLDDEEKFLYARAVVLKSTIIAGDWNNIKNFEYIKSVSGDRDIYLYASNIVEVSSIPSITKKSSSKSIVHNICSLEPVLTIHSRTSKKDFLDINPRPTLSLYMKPRHILFSTCKMSDALFDDLNKPTDGCDLIQLDKNFWSINNIPSSFAPPVSSDNITPRFVSQSNTRLSMSSFSSSIKGNQNNFLETYRSISSSRIFFNGSMRLPGNSDNYIGDKSKVGGNISEHMPGRRGNIIHETSSLSNTTLTLMYNRIDNSAPRHSSSEGTSSYSARRALEVDESRLPLKKRRKYSNI